MSHANEKGRRAYQLKRYKRKKNLRINQKFDLVSFFNGISIFKGYLDTKCILVEKY